MGWFKPGTGDCVCIPCNKSCPDQLVTCNDSTQKQIVQVAFEITLPATMYAFTGYEIANPSYMRIDVLKMMGMDALNGTYTANLNMDTCSWEWPTISTSYDYEVWHFDWAMNADCSQCLFSPCEHPGWADICYHPSWETASEACLTESGTKTLARHVQGHSAPPQHRLDLRTGWDPQSSPWLSQIFFGPVSHNPCGVSSLTTDGSGWDTLAQTELTLNSGHCADKVVLTGTATSYE